MTSYFDLLTYELAKKNNSLEQNFEIYCNGVYEK